MPKSERGAERYYRDAVHNIIRVDARTAEGRLFADLIDTPEFQRLRRIRQLGLAYFAYQSAEHSRFTHSLGAFNLATRVLAKLSAEHKISDEERIAVRAAALPHDIGHGAFSHVIEAILVFHHEDYSVAAITEPQTAINQVLTAFSPSLADDVASMIKGTFRRRALAQLISSQLDVDRMDYLLRDSLMTGAKYGVYDLEWIVKSIEIDEDNDRIFVAAPGIAAVEDYLQARYYMFRQVYFHRTLRAAESVLKSLPHRAIAVYSAGGDVWHLPGSSVGKILQGERLDLEKHLELDDTDVLFHIKQWRSSSDAILSDLAKRFIERQIFKAFDLDMNEAEKAVFLGQARSVVERHGFDPEYYLVEDSAKHADYYFYSRDTHDPKNLIFVEYGYSRPEIREISEVSGAVRGLQEGYRAQRVCFPAELRTEIEALYRP